MKQQLKKEEANPIAVFGFIVLATYFFLVYIAYNANFPSFNNFLDNYYTFSDPQGELFQSFAVITMGILVSVVGIIGIFGISIVMYYCTKHFLLFLVGLDQN